MAARLAYLRNTNFLQVLADGGELLILFLWQMIWSVPGVVVALGFGALAWSALAPSLVAHDAEHAYARS